MTKRLCLLLTGLFLLSRHAFAQAPDDYGGNYRFEPASRQRIFSDTAYIRSAASSSASLQDTVFAFDEITVLRQESAQLTVGRKTAPWYRVKYARRGKSSEGYLWGGALALRADEHDGVLFTFGLLSFPQPLTATDEGWEPGAKYNTCVLKVRDRSGRVQQCSYSIYPESGYFSLGYKNDSEQYSNPFRPAGSLPAGAKFRLAYGMNGEACGIPAYEMGALWDGKTLIRMPVLESGADAGVYSYEEEYVYPGEKGGRQGLLTVRNTALEYADDDGGGMEPREAKRTVTTRTYRWDPAASRFVKVP